MKVSKTVSIDIDLLQRTLQVNESFSQIVSLALESYLFFQKETERGNTVYFCKSFTTKVPLKSIWRLLSIENMVNWVNPIESFEYLSEKRNGEGAKFRLSGRLNGKDVSSIFEVLEYREMERFVYRAEGDVTIISSVAMRSNGAKNEISTVGVIGLSPEIASPELYREVASSLESAIGFFEKMANIND